MFLYFLAGWAEAWSASGRTSPSMSFVMGLEQASKRAAWTAIEGTNTMGQVTVWESGECNIEVYTTDTADEVLNEVLHLVSVEELGTTLRRVLAACD